MLQEAVEYLRTFRNREDMAAIFLGLLLGIGQELIWPQAFDYGWEKEIIVAGLIGLGLYRIWDALTGRYYLKQRAKRMHELFLSRGQEKEARELATYQENYRRRVINSEQFLSSLNVLAEKSGLFLKAK
ncbi:MAG: hypothetical protein AAF433_11205 [Bacteroidota bacterium]